MEIQPADLAYWAKFAMNPRWRLLHDQFKAAPEPKPRIMWEKGDFPRLESKRRKRKRSRNRGESVEQPRRRRRRKRACTDS